MTPEALAAQVEQMRAEGIPDAEIDQFVIEESRRLAFPEPRPERVEREPGTRRLWSGETVPVKETGLHGVIDPETGETIWTPTRHAGMFEPPSARRAETQLQDPMQPSFTQTPGSRPWQPGGQPIQPQGAVQAGAGASAGRGWRVSGARGGRTRGEQYLTGVTERAEESRELITGAAELAEAATRRAEKQKGMTAEATADIMMETEIDIAERRLAHREREAGIRKNKQEAWDRVTNIQHRMSEATIDPQRYFKDGGSLWAAVAIALGAFGQAFQRTSGDKKARNMGVDAMMKAIDNDLQAQAMEIDKLGLEASVANNVLARYQAELGDERLAWAAARAGMIQQGLRQIDIVHQQGAMAISDADADLVVAGLQQEEAKALADLNKPIDTAAANKYTQEEAMRRTQATIAASERARAQAMAAKAEQGKLIGGLHRLPGFAQPSAKNVEKTRLDWGKYRMVDSKLDELIQRRGDTGAGLAPDRWFEGDAQAREILTQLIIDLKEMKGMGAHFTEMEKELINLPENAKAFGRWYASMQKKRQLYNRDMRIYLDTSGWGTDRDIGTGEVAGR